MEETWMRGAPTLFNTIFKRTRSQIAGDWTAAYRILKARVRVLVSLKAKSASRCETRCDSSQVIGFSTSCPVPGKCVFFIVSAMLSGTRRRCVLDMCMPRLAFQHGGHTPRGSKHLCIRV